MKKIASIFMFLLVMSFASGAKAYTVTAYTDYVSWLNAINLSQLVVENYQDATFETGFSITETNGAGIVHYGVYENIVDQDVPRFQVFNYAPGMTAFGGFYDLANPGGAGTGIDMYINDNNQFVLSIPNSATGQFYGFVADGNFTGVKLQDAGGQGLQETYYVIDNQLASAVPIPPAIFLLGSGLLGLGFVKRRTRS